MTAYRVWVIFCDWCGKVYQSDTPGTLADAQGDVIRAGWRVSRKASGEAHCGNCLWQRERVARTIAHAAGDWVDEEIDGHTHISECVNWKAYLHEADTVLEFLRSAQEIMKGRQA